MILETALDLKLEDQSHPDPRIIATDQNVKDRDMSKL
jgi:hypothetical protein